MVVIDGLDLPAGLKTDGENTSIKETNINYESDPDWEEGGSIHGTSRSVESNSW
jgi:hypothetical protein